MKTRPLKTFPLLIRFRINSSSDVHFCAWQNLLQAVTVRYSTVYIVIIICQPSRRRRHRCRYCLEKITFVYCWLLWYINEIAIQPNKLSKATVLSNLRSVPNNWNRAIQLMHHFLQVGISGGPKIKSWKRGSRGRLLKRASFRGTRPLQKRVYNNNRNNNTIIILLLSVTLGQSEVYER